MREPVEVVWQVEHRVPALTVVRVVTRHRDGQHSQDGWLQMPTAQWDTPPWQALAGQVHVEVVDRRVVP